MRITYGDHKTYPGSAPFQTNRNMGILTLKELTQLMPAMGELLHCSTALIGWRALYGMDAIWTRSCMSSNLDDLNH